MPKTLEREEVRLDLLEVETPPPSPGRGIVFRTVAVIVLVLAALLLGWLLYDTFVASQDEAPVLSTTSVDPALQSQLQWHELERFSYVDPALEAAAARQGGSPQADSLLQASIRQREHIREEGALDSWAQSQLRWRELQTEGDSLLRASVRQREHLEE
jgi:hypothetical protein